MIRRGIAGVGGRWPLAHRAPQACRHQWFSVGPDLPWAFFMHKLQPHRKGMRAPRRKKGATRDIGSPTVEHRAGPASHRQHSQDADCLQDGRITTVQEPFPSWTAGLAFFWLID